VSSFCEFCDPVLVSETLLPWLLLTTVGTDEEHRKGALFPFTSRGFSFILMWSFCVHTTGASALLFVTILEDRVSRSFRIIFLSSFALLFIFVAVFLTAGDSVDANPPSYWITIDESEFEHVAAAGLKQGFEIVERRGGLAIVKLDENQIFELTGKMHEHFHKCAGFIRHDSYDDASRSIDKSFAADLNAVFVDYTINNDANVNPMLAEAQEPFIRQTIIDLSSLHTRRHDQQGGLDGANMILNKWRALNSAARIFQ
jgi:hypothetical protein